MNSEKPQKKHQHHARILVPNTRMSDYKASPSKYVTTSVKRDLYEAILRDAADEGHTFLTFVEHALDLYNLEHPSDIITLIKRRAKRNIDSVFIAEMEVVYKWLEKFMYDSGLSN